MLWKHTKAQKSGQTGINGRDEGGKNHQASTGRGVTRMPGQARDPPESGASVTAQLNTTCLASVTQTRRHLKRDAHVYRTVGCLMHNYH